MHFTLQLLRLVRFFYFHLYFFLCLQYFIIYKLLTSNTGGSCYYFFFCSFTKCYTGNYYWYFSLQKRNTFFHMNINVNIYIHNFYVWILQTNLQKKIHLCKNIRLISHCVYYNTWQFSLNNILTAWMYHFISKYVSTDNFVIYHPFFLHPNKILIWYVAQTKKRQQKWTKRQLKAWINYLIVISKLLINKFAIRMPLSYMENVIKLFVCTSSMCVYDLAFPYYLAITMFSCSRCLAAF